MMSLQNSLNRYVSTWFLQHLNFIQLVYIEWPCIQWPFVGMLLTSGPSKLKLLQHPCGHVITNTCQPALNYDVAMPHGLMIIICNLHCLLLTSIINGEDGRKLQMVICSKLQPCKICLMTTIGTATTAIIKWHGQVMSHFMTVSLFMEVPFPIIIIKQGISALADKVAISLASPEFRFSLFILLHFYKHKFVKFEEGREGCEMNGKRTAIASNKS